MPRRESSRRRPAAEPDPTPTASGSGQTTPKAPPEQASSATSREVDPAEARRLFAAAKRRRGNDHLPDELPGWAPIFWVVEWHGEATIPADVSIGGQEVRLETDWLYAGKTLLGEVLSLMPPVEGQAERRLLVCCMPAAGGAA